MAMNETAHGEKHLSVTRTIEAPSKDVFDVLTLPQRHAEFDGSDMVRADDKSQRIQRVGDVFRMNMYAEHMGGDYKTDNHVSAYDENKMVGWKTAVADTEPPGWEWLYTLESKDNDTTEVTLTYDWSKVEDKELLEKNMFPLVSEEQLDGSLAQLAAAVR